MKSLNTIKSITKAFSCISITCFVIYVIFLSAFRAAAFESITSEDICSFVAFGLVTLMLALFDYFVGVFRQTLRRQLRRKTKRA